MTGPISADQPVQNPLTLVMTARSADNRRMLQEKLAVLQSLPREQNPAVAALDELATAEELHVAVPLGGGVGDPGGGYFQGGEQRGVAVAVQTGRLHSSGPLADAITR
jgi:hypothetical protein